MKDLSVSLIIPAYNEEHYIGRCLESIEANAKDKFIEVIVVDNASTDRTSEIASRFPFVTLIKEPNKGVMRARDKGCRISRGDILAFIDADSEMPSMWFERIEKEFNDDATLALLSGPYDYYDLSLIKRMLAELYFFIAMIVYHIVGYMAIFGNMALRRSVLQSMSGLDTSIEFYGDDTNTARRAMKFGKIKFVWDFRMRSSGRRIEKQGLFMTPFLYVRNFLSEVAGGKRTPTYKDFR